MATNLALDDRLIARAKKIGKHRTKRDAVNAALEEYVARRERLKILDLVGKIDMVSDDEFRTMRGKPPLRRRRR